MNQEFKIAKLPEMVTDNMPADEVRALIEYAFREGCEETLIDLNASGQASIENLWQTSVARVKASGIKLADRFDSLGKLV